MKANKKKFSDLSSRLQSWDYARCGYYFITCVVQNRHHHFGEIRDGIMHKTPLGEFAEESWKRTVELRPGMNIWLGEFVVMPDHFHAIIFIGNNEYNASLVPSALDCSTSSEFIRELTRPKNSFGPQSKNLASIVRGFKASVTTEARRQGVPFEWVSRYHDSILRNTGDFNFARNYIRNNVRSWRGDFESVIACKG
jgi:REP element-mobilizing transposase RayT